MPALGPSVLSPALSPVSATLSRARTGQVPQVPISRTRSGAWRASCPLYCQRLGPLWRDGAPDHYTTRHFLLDSKEHGPMLQDVWQ